jgi:TonB family protein
MNFAPPRQLRRYVSMSAARIITAFLVAPQMTPVVPQLRRSSLFVIRCLSIALWVVVAAQAQEGPTQYSTPVIMFRSVPGYPPLARVAHAIGTVNVDATVSQDGTVISARSIDGHPLLRGAAEVSARGWQFVPQTDPGLRLVRLMFTFRIVSDASDLDVQATFITPYHVEITRAPNVISDPPAILTRRKHRSKRRNRVIRKRTRRNKALQVTAR